jgi:hypothetical protein
MLLSRVILPALAASFLATASFAADAPPAPPPHGDHDGGFMHSLTPDQRTMLFAERQKDSASMTDDQRHASREAQHAKFAAMSDAEKQKFAADLQARWDALSADQKAKIQQDMAAFRASHPMMGRDHPDHGAGQ